MRLAGQKKGHAEMQKTCKRIFEAEAIPSTPNYENWKPPDNFQIP